MKAILQKIWRLAKPYLNTRWNDLHVELSMEFAYRLMEEEGGDEDIVIPAIILHDVGWKKIPEELHEKAFGPKMTSARLNRIHEVEGVKIAADILRAINYDGDKIAEILEIIEGHDSREHAISTNDQIVKDADKLFRYSKEGFTIDVERFGVTFDAQISRLRSHLETWFLTDSGKAFATEDMEELLKATQGKR
jgi:HD superfamily phosphodiesterase